jgi:short-subunit dehydrogenase
MRALREIGPSTGVSVSCIAPGGTASGMVTPAIQASMRAQGITVQTPDYVAQAAVMLASNKEWNGKSLALLGFHTTEVEGPLADLMPQWYGQYHTEMAKKAASVVVK